MANAAFWDRIARKYADTPISNIEAYEYTLGRTKSYLHGTDNVLELGCGTASTALLLAPGVGHITATDISDEMVQIGREKAQAEGIDNITNLVATFGNPDLGSDYDAVLAFNLLHLTDDPVHAVAEAYRMTKPGGLFISKTPCLEGIWGLLRLPGAVMYALGKWPKVQFLTQKRLDKMIADAGFDIIESGNDAKKLPVRYIVARKPG